MTIRRGEPELLGFLGWWILVRSEALLYYPPPSYLGVSERNSHVHCLRVNKENLAKIREVVLLYFFRFVFFPQSSPQKMWLWQWGVAYAKTWHCWDGSVHHARPWEFMCMRTLCKVPVLMKGTCCQGQARNDVHDVQSTCLRENEPWILTLAMSAKAPVWCNLEKHSFWLVLT